jgi:hypothetical protein
MVSIHRTQKHIKFYCVNECAHLIDDMVIYIYRLSYAHEYADNKYKPDVSIIIL